MQKFNDSQFERFSAWIYQNFGIYYSREKQEILQTKLIKLMLKYNVNSYDQYYRALIANESAQFLNDFIDEITIHKTDFFRENNHFEYIRNNLHSIMQRNKNIANTGEIRAWSAGCSTGEEAYTLAITLQECLPPNIQIKILATDVSTGVVKKALRGVYPQTIQNQIAKHLLLKYFVRNQEGWEVSSAIKNPITFRSFNLALDFPFKRGFDIIFCRNVLIYFDAASQQQLIDKFYNALNPGGLFFMGHSEGLVNKKHQFQYLEPTIYLK